ncbi:hypothetical protein [Acanthamoeba polyphaga mimivirus]|nr:hypothetical protein [Acanthamoeba castellanii mamavirus]EJN40996.1 hypothetical protein lvs_R493 [Acanthamoeba polyphaga lentillevirus]UMZ07894.1 hypothetical protein [Acanthamoeba polyphaga mimivirus]
MNDQNSNQFIIYDSNNGFVITPKLTNNIISKLIDFIDQSRNSYREYYGVNCFLWKLDLVNNAIISDSAVEFIIDNDIFSQLSHIASYLFNHYYRLKGTFYCRTENIIEYIYMDGLTNLLTHYVLIDTIDSMCNDDSNDNEKLLSESKEKLNVFIKSTKGFTSDSESVEDIEKNNQSNITCKKIYYVNKIYNNPIINIGDSGKYSELKTKVNDIENDLRTLSSNTNLLWKISALMSMIIVGTVCYLRK